MYTVYSAEWCKYCDKAKELLASKDLPFEVIDVESIGKEGILKGLGFLPKTIPQITKDGEYVGGFTELVKYLED